MNKEKTIKVASVSDEYTLIVTAGKEDGVQIGQRFLVYTIGEEILDPDSGESLGKLEIIKGTGKVTHVQDKISTLYSDMKVPAHRTIRKSNPSGILGGINALMGSTETEEYLPPEPKMFEDPRVGDIAKPI